MPLIIRVPRNRAVLRRRGAYVRALNVLNRHETAVQRQLRRGGLASYEPTTQATLLALVEVASKPVVFLDVGAHIGLYSALMDAIFPQGEVDVRAFEPTPATADIARRLSHANGLTIMVEEVAVSSVEGKAQLYVSAKSESSNSMTEGFREALDVLDVEVTTIDAYCKRSGIDPSVVKIDVETLEAQVLEGSFETLQRSRPAIVFEILLASDHAHLARTLERLEGIGYSLFRVDVSAGWTRTDVAQYRRYVSKGQRDWLLLPGEPTRRFERARRRWDAAITDCDQSTNLLVPRGTRPPRGWDDLYPRSEWTVRRIVLGALRRGMRSIRFLLRGSA